MIKILKIQKNKIKVNNTNKKIGIIQIQAQMMMKNKKLIKRITNKRMNLQQMMNKDMFKVFSYNFIFLINVILFKFNRIN